MQKDFCNGIGQKRKCTGDARGAAKRAIRAKYAFFCAKINDTERDRRTRHGSYTCREI